MALSASSLAEQLPSLTLTHLRDLDLLNIFRENPGPLDDLNTHDALERGYLDADTQVLQHDTGIEALRQEIETLEKRLDTLHHNRSLLKPCSETCKSLSKQLNAPIRKIPDDVLTTIFGIVCTDPLDIRLGQSDWRPIHPHRMVAGVCYRWRHLVLSSSFLWTNLTISCFGQPKAQWSAENQLSFLTELMLRSKLSPLRVELAFAPEEEDTPFCCSVLSILEPHLATRCQSMTFLGPAMPLNTVRTPLSALHTISMYPYYEVESLNHRHAFTAPLPVLRTLELGVCPSRLNFELDIKWHTLTKLRTRYWEMREVHRILTQCINLEKLTLHSTKHSEGTIRPQAPTSLPSLYYLEIRPAYRAPPSSERLHADLVQALHMPSLRSLTLTCLHDVRPFFQTLTACPLTSLDLKMSTNDLPRVRSLLKSYPSLETLSLQAHNPTDMAFDDTSLELWQSLETLLLEMTVKADEPVFLPRLSKIRFDVRTTQHRDQPHSKSSCSALVNMAYSRHNPPHASGVSRLRSLSVLVSAWDENRETEAILVTGLKELEGMDVRLKAWDYQTYAGWVCSQEAR